METLYTLLFILQVLIAVTLVGMILIQHGKGADAGVAFGSGASSTVFGSRGSGSFLVKITAILAFVFLLNSLLLGYLTSQKVQQMPASILDKPNTLPEQALPEQTILQETTGSDIPNLPTE